MAENFYPVKSYIQNQLNVTKMWFKNWIKMLICDQASDRQTQMHAHPHMKYNDILIDMQHFALCMSLCEYVIIYTTTDHIVQTSAHNCLVTTPLPSHQEYRDPPFSEKERKSKRSPP